jgi:hypothetical protein
VIVINYEIISVVYSPAKTPENEARSKLNRNADFMSHILIAFSNQPPFLPLYSASFVKPGEQHPAGF